MSYSILYRSFGIRLANNKILVAAETGCNNVYDTVGRGARRSRDWGIEKLNGKIQPVTPSELSEWCDNQNRQDYEFQEGYVPEKFGWFKAIAVGGRKCSSTKFSDYKNFYMSATKRNFTFEELRELGVGLEIRVRVWGETSYATPYRKTVWTEPDFSASIIEAEKLIATEHPKGIMYVAPVGVDWAWDKMFPKKSKNKFAIKIGERGFVTGSKTRLFFMGWENPKAYTRAAADKYLLRIPAHHGASVVPYPTTK